MLKAPNIDACLLFRLGSINTMVSGGIMYLTGKIPFIPTKCPLKPGKFYSNTTVTNLPDPKTATREEIVNYQRVEKSLTCLKPNEISKPLLQEVQGGQKSFLGSPLPNGIYKFKFQYSTKADKEFYCFTGLWDFKQRVKPDDF
jgi:hypothetical protein